jgi:hypothetical protein
MTIPDSSWGSAVLLHSATNKWKMVANAAQAFDLLTKEWPTTSGRAFFRALQICSGAGEGLFSPFQARLAFLEAVQEAHIATH